MNEQVFWKLIEALHPEVYTNQERLDKIILDVAKLENEYIFKFEKILHWLLKKSDKEEIWAASYIFLKQNTDESYLKFRLWLIFQGQRIFKKAINDAEMLEVFIDHFVFKKVQMDKYASILNLASVAFFKKNGSKNYKNPLPLETHHSDLPAQLSNEDVKDILPELCHKMGWDIEVFKGDWETDQ